MKFKCNEYLILTTLKMSYEKQSQLAEFINSLYGPKDLGSHSFIYFRSIYFKASLQISNERNLLIINYCSLL